MKTTLVKIDSSNNRRKILSLNEEDMKAFILLFKNMEELKDYFLQMMKNVVSLLYRIIMKIIHLINFIFQMICI